METKRAKVKERKSYGTQDNYGNHSFIVTFENGDSGFYKSKSESPNFFVVDTECDYTIERKESKAGKEYFIIKPPQELKPFTKSFGKKPEELKLQQASFSMSYSKDLVVQGTIPKELIFEYADSIYDWINKKTKIDG